jgi:hypothetical protein
VSTSSTTFVKKAKNNLDLPLSNHTLDSFCATSSRKVFIEAAE